ncbi:MAG: hypothetical protein IT478_17690 [Xanthomonadales bacterium]|nr:hypothetical protein [Xanthomonadales bacterium]
MSNAFDLPCRNRRASSHEQAALMTEQTFLHMLIIGLFLVVFPMFWCAIVLLLAFVSGWRKLAENYATEKEPRGTVFRWVNGSVGIVSYKHCPNAHVADEGLYLSVLFFFRIGHEQLLIPWAEIRSGDAVAFLWHRAVCLEIGSPPVARIKLPQNVVDAAGDRIAQRDAALPNTDRHRMRSP